MKQHMVHRVVQEITPLRRPPPFFAAQKTRKLRLGNAGKPSLLTRHVHQTEREAPPAQVTPHRESSSTQTSSSSDNNNSEHHGLLSDKAEQPPTPTASLHSSTNADSASSSSTQAETTTDPSAQATDHVPPSPASPGPNQQPPSDPAPGPFSSRPRRPSFAFQKPSAAVVLATYGAYIGAVGTLAVGTAWATDINLAAMFRWDPQDIEQALLALIPLAALNTLIMLPDYSNWSLPNLDEKEAAEALLPSTQTPAAEATASADPSLASSTATLAPASTPAASAALRAEGEAGAAAASSGIKKTPAAAWGKKKGVLRVFKDAMHLAQGHYTANNPTASMNPVVDALTASAQSLAAELLYRGVVITLLQTWVLDRLYEAGADDVMSLPFLSQPMDTSDAALWGAAWLLVAVSSGLALRKVFSPRRPRLIQILDMKQAQAQARGKGVVKPSPAAAAAAEQIPRDFHQTTTLAAAVQGARNVLQTLVLNTVFVMSGGNLAASVSASLVNQLLFSALQRQNATRMQKRSAALAKELEAFNLRLREIQRKKQAREAAAAAAAAAAGTMAPAEDQPGAAGLWEPAALGQAGGDSLGEVDGSHGLAARMHEEGSAAQGADGGEVLLHAAAVATAASAASAQGSGVVAAAAAAGGGHGGGGMGSGPDQLTRALMALDLLLPPEPSKAPAAAPKPRLEK